MSAVSALICTRNRPADLARAARSILRAADVPDELIVMDQSDGDETALALGDLMRDPRLRYVRAGRKGKGAALNEGVRIARHDIVVCTDDDCEAPDGWVAGIARKLEEQPSVAIVFSNVSSPDYDHAIGYIPTYVRSEDRLLRSVMDLCRGYGIGAGWALRRSAILELGGCDEAFGPGSRFPSCDDLDLAVRALLLGWQVYDTAEVSIVHHGFRTFAEGRAHARRDWVAIGATCSKPLRGGRPTGAAPTLWIFATTAVWPPVADLLHLRKPRGLTRITAFVSGFIDGLRTPVDRNHLLYRPPNGT